MRRHLLPTALLVTFCASAIAPFCAPWRAAAWDVEINSETIGQAYQLLGPTSSPGDLISRRRLDQYLGFHVWNLGKKDAFGIPLPDNQFYFTSSLRLDFDFGSYPPSRDGGGRDTIGGVDVTKELGNNRVELLYAYIGGRDVLGFIDFKLGRQYEYDLFEFLNYDGLSVEAKTPYYLALDAYAGLLVNGYLPIDSPIFRPDGTAPGALSVHDSDAKPVVGVSLRAFGFRDLDARFSYRRVFSPSSDVGCPAGSTSGATDIRTLESCTKSVNGTSEEKIGWNGRYRLLDGKIIPWFGIRYDLVNGLVDLIEAGARFNLTEHHGLQAEYLYSYPTFDGDSIWNLFARTQFDDVRLAYDLRYGRFRGWARGLLRFFHDIDEADRLNGPPPVSPLGKLDGGGSLGGRYDLPRGFLRGDLYYEGGYGGTKLGADLSTRIKVFRDLASLEARLTYVHFQDDLRLTDHADSVGLSVGGRIAFYRGMLLHLMVEDNVNRFYNSQLRFYALLDVTAILGGYGFKPGAPRGIGPGAGGFGSAYGMGMGYRCAACYSPLWRF